MRAGKPEGKMQKAREPRREKERAESSLAAPCKAEDSACEQLSLSLRKFKPNLSQAAEAAKLRQPS